MMQALEMYQSMLQVHSSLLHVCFNNNLQSTFSRCFIINKNFVSHRKQDENRQKVYLLIWNVYKCFSLKSNVKNKLDLTCKEYSTLFNYDNFWRCMKAVVLKPLHEVPPSTAHFVCLPISDTHFRSCSLHYWAESGVIDEGDTKCARLGYSRTGLRPLH